MIWSTGQTSEIWESLDTVSSVLSFYQTVSDSVRQYHTVSDSIIQFVPKHLVAEQAKAEQAK